MRRFILLALLAVALGAISIAGFLDSQNVNPPAGTLPLTTRAEPDAPALARRLSAVAGFRADLFADGLPGPRLIALTPGGDLLVSAPKAGSVLVVAADRDGDGMSDGTATLLDGLDRPHGLALREGDLTIATTGQILRVALDDAHRRALGEPEVVFSGLPRGGGHSTRTIAFGPDGRLYVTAGSSCNVCIEADATRATMLSLDADGGRAGVYASGLRNTVGFDWRPGTGELYGVDNGRDLLGDDVPPDELNLIEEGGFYGWPFFNGDNVPDPDLGADEEAAGRNPIAPVYGFAAHVAPLSVRFLRHQPDPAWNGTALVALHGSWNRSTRIGYAVVALRWRGDGEIEEQPFLDGFRDGEQVFGRPVDVVEAPDGTIYVSDDYAGAVWRVTPTP